MFIVRLMTTEGSVELYGARAEDFARGARALYAATHGCQCHVCGSLLGRLAELAIMGSCLDTEMELAREGHSNAHVLSATWETYERCFCIALETTHEVAHVHTGAKVVWS